MGDCISWRFFFWFGAGQQLLSRTVMGSFAIGTAGSEWRFESSDGSIGSGVIWNLEGIRGS